MFAVKSSQPVRSNEDDKIYNLVNNYNDVPEILDISEFDIKIPENSDIFGTTGMNSVLIFSLFKKIKELTHRIDTLTAHALAMKELNEINDISNNITQEHELEMVG